MQQILNLKVDGFDSLLTHEEIQTRDIPGSSNGRTADSDSANVGSTPAPGTTRPSQGLFFYNLNRTL